MRVLVDGTRTVAAGTTSGADGRFAVSVPAGDYVLEVSSRFAMTCGEVPVTVPPGTRVDVTVDCDTGIR